MQLGGEVSILAGIYVGRVGVTDEQDPQVGIVWHSDVIDEIIDGARHEEHPDSLGILPRDLEKAINEVLATLSKEGLENAKNPDVPTRYYLQREVLKRIEGRATSENVLSNIVALAEQYNGPLRPSE